MCALPPDNKGCSDRHMPAVGWQQAVPAYDSANGVNNDMSCHHMMRLAPHLSLLRALRFESRPPFQALCLHRLPVQESCSQSGRRREGQAHRRAGRQAGRQTESRVSDTREFLEGATGQVKIAMRQERAFHHLLSMGTEREP